MVVLAASVINKSGKVLVSRSFMNMSRIRIEGLLAAFPKLVDTGKQHTYVETDDVRYVYQPIEAFYLLLVTNKQSNILEDLDTLRLFSEVVSKHVSSLDEEGICKAAFKLIWALDEAISLGHKENVTVAQVKKYCEMDSPEEKMHKLILQRKINETKEVMKLKSIEIDKIKINTRRVEKRGYVPSMGPERMERTFSDMSISSIGSGSGFGVTPELESKAKGPPKGLGMQLGKSQKYNQLLKSLKAEGEQIVDDVQPNTDLSKSVASPLIDPPVTLNVEERLNITLKRDGGVGNFEVQGTLSLQIHNQQDAHIQVQIETGGNPGILFRTHPNLSKELFSNENILGLKYPDRPFPSTGEAGDTGGIGLLKWRMQSQDESMVPLIINCWPTVFGNETYVNIDYEAQPKFDLLNVVISVPLPALREAPNVKQIDGEWRYDSKNSILEWSILLIDHSNRSGALEFVIPPVESTSALFPIHVRFSAATSTFSDLKVVNILPLNGGSPPKFSQMTQLITENYQVV